MTRRWTSEAVVLTASFLALAACDSSPAADQRDFTEPVSDAGYPGGGRGSEPMVLPTRTAAPAVTTTPTRAVTPARTTKPAKPTRTVTPAATIKTNVVGRGSTTGATTGGDSDDDTGSGSVGG